MSGKLVKHKLHAEWGIGKIKNNPMTYQGKVNVKFENYPRNSDVLCSPRNLIEVGFYD